MVLESFLKIGRKILSNLVKFSLKYDDIYIAEGRGLRYQG